MSGNNVVRMPGPAPTAAPQPQSGPPWAMNPIYPIPPGPWSMSGVPAGCCPPSGMTDLMKCYCDIQAATAFISKVVTDLAANDPAFQKALVDGIVASGSNIPLIGVTNGTAAQAGQVGEYFEISAGFPFAATGGTSQQLTLGVLQPGDWDGWMWATFADNTGSGVTVNGASFFLFPVPAGTAADLSAAIYSAGAPVGLVLSSMATQIITAVPVLIAASANVTGGGTAGSMNVVFAARRRR